MSMFTVTFMINYIYTTHISPFMKGIHFKHSNLMVSTMSSIKLKIPYLHFSGETFIR